MNTKRFLATLPETTANALQQFACEQNIHASFIAQRAVTAMSEHMPTEDDIEYLRGETSGVQLTFSDTAYRLLELWSKQTGLSKSKLIAYSIQQMEKGEKI